MIQRMQSVWLLLAGITMVLLLFIPMATNFAGGTEYQVVASGMYTKVADGPNVFTPSYPLAIFVGLIALLCFANIFNFKNRSFQKRGAFIAIVLTIGASFWCSQIAQHIPGGLKNATYGVGTFLPMIAILFLALTIRGIDRDEKLIRSADRLR